MSNLYVIACLLLLAGCSKSEFLSENPNRSQIVPTTLDDFQAILDRDIEMNGVGSTARGPVPGIGEAASDSYYVTDADFNGMLQPQIQNYYLWAAEPYVGDAVYDWDYPYLVIFSANVVLKGLENLAPTSTDVRQYNMVKGQAHFHRAHAYFQLAQIFAPPYHKGNLTGKWGLPLRLEADLNEPVKRATLQETYNLILNDLSAARELLAADIQVKTRASKQAAFALLARTYLIMQEYESAYTYADSCLQLMGNLLDYNEINAELSYPFVAGSQEHREVIFSCNMISRPLMSYPFRPTFARVDSVLYASYDEHDLRKKVFFNQEENGVSFKGSYDGREYNFAGLASDEVYLIRAEAAARLGNTEQALNDLNRLKAARWEKNVAFQPYSATSQEEALAYVLAERKKELLFRGLRWSDLRRLNLEGRAISIERMIDGKMYALLPNDPRYTYPIPNEVIAFHPDMPQNER
ncbi:RagB/SusD family nutrient uptake outer membrane protein [Olivibacter sp. XZL3]|uniref:RagB/SusD family nutrient uptake outer membrane protein n=1 Tax=Olivibacter sp. XZL3 TaxID=1735116 RepID=UPI001066E416|nr:RagB/SusD family nutrient uptake outer membrane protein [Olivibacter sp. XZL3]